MVLKVRSLRAFAKLCGNMEKPEAAKNLESSGAIQKMQVKLFR
jgi:hypothetical protein